MQMVQVINGPVTNGVAELNHDTEAEKREIRDGVTGEGQELSEEDESRLNEDIEDRNVGGMELVQVQAHRGAIMQRSQQQPQGSLVHWERFLPLRSLKVLLVENDDSTRHVVSALLRNCGYEVKAVSNGLQAWKLLEDLTNHTDLVLTEVVMPCLSGIGLLSKIMNHKTCKNIPVIMMSSHDSISIVFKCLSKGAVDFLVKPIRKNELKHLWQHIWRKCHSSSGSGSESGVRTQKSTKSKSAEESDNHTGSNNKDDIGSIGLNAGDGSGTQSSWTKRAVEVDSRKSMSPWNKLADHPDSTCAQVIHSRTEAFGNNRVPVTTTKECEGKDDELDDVAMGKDLEIGVPRIPSIQLEDQSEMVLSNIAGKNGEKFPEMNSNKDSEQIENVNKEIHSQKPNGALIKQAANLRGAITDSANPQGESVVFNIPNGVSMISNTKDRVNYENKEIPSLELGLKRLQDVGDTANSDHDQNVLRHSDISAFSRYNSNSTAKQAPTGNVGSCSPLDNSSPAKTESMQNSLSNSSSTPPNQQSNGSSNNNDSSTTNNAFTKAAVFNNKSAPKPAVKFVHPSSACQTAVNVQNRHIPPPQPVHGKADAVVANTTMAQARSMNQQVQVQHHHHHYHHHHHHVHNISQQQQVTNHNELVSEKMAAAVPQSGSSNMLSTPIEGNPGIQGLNRSNSGRDHGSNGLNGSSTALNPRGTNVESDDGVAGNGGTSIGIGYGRRTGLDQNHSAQRDAALNKFRQKRKERCFEKKVRYQSRKKLAEQRPRFRGQFVRQATSESKEKNAPSSHSTVILRW